MALVRDGGPSVNPLARQTLGDTGNDERSWPECLTEERSNVYTSVASVTGVAPSRLVSVPRTYTTCSRGRISKVRSHREVASCLSQHAADTTKRYIEGRACIRHCRSCRGSPHPPCFCGSRFPNVQQDTHPTQTKPSQTIRSYEDQASNRLKRAPAFYAI